MITAPQSFLLGYTVPIVGIHFNATQLLAQTGEGATGELATRITHQTESFAARQRGVVDNVRHALSLLTAAEIDAGPPPRTPDEYFVWAERIQSEFTAHIAPQDLTLSSAYLFGQLLGSALLTLNLGLLTDYFLDAAPDHARLRVQAAALAADQSRLAATIARAAANPLLPAGARAPVEEFLAAFRAAPVIGTADHQAAVAGLQQAMRACGEKVQQVEKGFS